MSDDEELGQFILMSDSVLGNLDTARVLAHEMGHIFGLFHVCFKGSSADNPPPTLFGRQCIASDKQFLMWTGFKTTRSTDVSVNEARKARQFASLIHLLHN